MNKAEKEREGEIDREGGTRPFERGNSSTASESGKAGIPLRFDDRLPALDCVREKNNALSRSSNKNYRHIPRMYPSFHVTSNENFRRL